MSALLSALAQDARASVLAPLPEGTPQFSKLWTFEIPENISVDRLPEVPCAMVLSKSAGFLLFELMAGNLKYTRQKY